MCVVFKQKTAYEMRISDWSSDVCSSDLDFSNHPGPWPICAFPWSCRSYQGSVILTDEDGFWRFSARRLRRDDVGHRPKQAALYASRQTPSSSVKITAPWYQARAGVTSLCRGLTLRGAWREGGTGARSGDRAGEAWMVRSITRIICAAALA